MPKIFVKYKIYFLNYKLNFDQEMMRTDSILTNEHTETSKGLNKMISIELIKSLTRKNSKNKTNNSRNERPKRRTHYHIAKCFLKSLSLEAKLIIAEMIEK